MKKLTTLLVLAGVLACSGCSRPAALPLAPLSIAEWTTLPVEQKYTAMALERLKEGNPTLQTAEGWEQFSRTVLAENRKRDRLVRSAGIKK